MPWISTTSFYRVVGDWKISTRSRRRIHRTYNKGGGGRGLVGKIETRDAVAKNDPSWLCYYATNEYRNTIPIER
jgi:predicted enzyme related to lactoylglutathione lyase